jgi:hypothetical protein
MPTCQLLSALNNSKSRPNSANNCSYLWGQGLCSTIFFFFPLCLLAQNYLSIILPQWVVENLTSNFYVANYGPLWVRITISPLCSLTTIFSLAQSTKYSVQFNTHLFFFFFFWQYQGLKSGSCTC